MNLKPLLKETLDELGYHELTPIQQASLPHILEGKDVLAQAKTGSGKTAAFGLGILNQIELDSLELQSLIICPTRELAGQVADELRKIGRKLANLKIQLATGGTSEDTQTKSLEYGAHIVIGTPGRILKFLKSDILDTSRLKSFILDEADRMLDMGFIVPIEEIVSYIPKSSQALLFSATFPENIIDLSSKLQQDAIKIKVDTVLAKGMIDEYFYYVDGHQDKNDALLTVLSHFGPSRVLIFCKTKLLCDQVVSFLQKRNILAKAIHGDIKQNQRQSVLDQLSSHSLNIMVATDVAARGLDIKDLPFVINYDLTHEAEIYIHRKGRTARAGRRGTVISFIKKGSEYKLQNIEELTNQKITIDKLDSLDKAKEYQLTPPNKLYFISGGKKNKLRPGDIVGALVNELNISGEDIGNINIYPVFSYVAIKYDVPVEASSIVIKKKKFRLGPV